MECAVLLSLFFDIDETLTIQNPFCLDPDNKIYDEIDLNRGVKETFFSISTPFAFLKRIQKKNGLKELGQVLSKWNKGKKGKLKLKRKETTLLSRSHEKLESHT